MQKFKFIILSLLGLILFICPITINGNTTVFISHFNNFVSGNFSSQIGIITFVLQIIVLLGTILGIFIKDFKNDLLNTLLKSNFINTILRIAGSIIFLLVTLNVGPEFLIDKNTGGTVLGLVNTLYITFFAGIILLPLLTKFGAVEFAGVIVSPIMRKVFKVPGYAAVDALASFVGDGTIGIVVTEKQYLNGYYTQREAAVIASSFSIVGISFAIVVAEELGFSSIFGIFYASIFLVTILIAMVIARLPMKKFKNEYYPGTKQDHKKTLGDGSFKHAVKMGVTAATKSEPTKCFLEALSHVMIVYFTFIPIIMCVGTLGLIVAEYTQVFNIISIPLIPILQLLGFSSDVAKEMAPSMIVGFADMYLPALFISESASMAAKFFIGVLAFAQLVFLSETGMILVNSKIGFNFFDIIKLFITRTIIAVPIIFIITKLLLFAGILV